jgi:4-hydroxybenzoate polyprenyltransferase
MISLVKALRPQHWIKNSLVLAAFFFALGDKSQSSDLSILESALTAIGAALLFCGVSSGVYVMNDIRDIDLDRAHPLKKHRPIAAGKIPVPQAWALAAILLTGSVAGSYLLRPELAIVLGGYVLLQVAYSFRLKSVALLDVFVIAIGFVLRALAGAVALDVTISPWLVLCTFLLALFLGFCKRRHEKVLLEDYADETRPSLSKYNAQLLDQVIAIVAASTIVSYALYTLSPDTVSKFGSAHLGFTIPFVMFGIFRYLDLVYRHEKGSRPETILLTDVPLLLDMALYASTVLFIFSRSCL